MPEKNPNAVALSKLGASKGGNARAAALSTHKRAAIAKKAARARWDQRKINHMLTYSQTSAIFTDDTGQPQSGPGDFYAGGDAGTVPEAVNNHAFEQQHNTGPLPVGFYTIGEPTTDSHIGPVMWLAPDPANVMYSRSAFGIHCKNSKRDAGMLGTPAGRNSSDGCIVAVPYAAWLKIANLQKAGEIKLQVVI